MTEKQIKELEPRFLNGIVYRYVKIENSSRQAERLLAEEPKDIPFVNYFEALETCKQLKPEVIEKLTDAYNRAQAEATKMFDAECSRILMAQIHCL